MALEPRTALPRFEIRPLTPEEGGGYLLEFPDYPGCMSDGETPEDAIREGADALKSYLETLTALGRPVPKTGDLYAGQWRQQFSPRLRLAAAFAHCAMRPMSAAPLMALARTWPGLLTVGARWGGKTRLKVDAGLIGSAGSLSLGERVGERDYAHETAS